MSSQLTSAKALLYSAVLLVATFIAELIGGLIFGSLSLISDSFHVISDLISILVAYIALTIAERKTPTQQMAYGYHRLEIISALFNGILLSIISAFIFIEAWSRFKNPGTIDTTGALIVASLGLVINFIVARIFHSTSTEISRDVNIQSAYFHVLGDILASISVVVGLAAVRLLDMPVIDPIVAGFVALLILVSAGRVLYRSSEILLHKSPQDIDRVQKRVMEIQGVEDFMDIRLWQVCSHLTVGTAHVVVSVKSLQETEPIMRKIRSIIRKEFDIRDITLECETREMSTNHEHTFEHRHE